MPLAHGHELARTPERPKDKLSRLMSETFAAARARGEKVETVAGTEFQSDPQGFFRRGVSTKSEYLKIQIGDTSTQIWRREQTRKIFGVPISSMVRLGVYRETVQEDGGVADFSSWETLDPSSETLTVDGPASTTEFESGSPGYDFHLRDAISAVEVAAELAKERHDFIQSCLAQRANALGYRSIKDLQSRNPTMAGRVARAAKEQFDSAPYAVTTES